jgi:hypothetical protein
MSSSRKMLVLGVKRMLKFKDKNGKLRYILLDEDTQPREVNEITEEILKEYGFLEEELDEETKRKIRTHGISQDDLKMLKG